MGFISANAASLNLRDAAVRMFAGSSRDFGARVRWQPVMGGRLVAAIMNDVAKAGKSYFADHSRLANCTE